MRPVTLHRLPGMAATRLLCTALALVVLTGACGGSGDRSTTGVDSTVRIPKESLGPLLQAASPEERGVLKDGELTLAEYESQMLALVACARESGFQLADEPSLPKWGGYALRFSRPVGSDSADAAANTQRSIDQCRRDHFEVVDMLWSEAHRPPETELQKARDALGTCLREAGIGSPPEHPAPGTLLRQSTLPDGRVDERFFVCSEHVADEFGLPGFAG